MALGFLLAPECHHSLSCTLAAVTGLSWYFSNMPSKILTKVICTCYSLPTHSAPWLLYNVVPHFTLVSSERPCLTTTSQIHSSSIIQPFSQFILLIAHITTWQIIYICMCACMCVFWSSSSSPPAYKLLQSRKTVLFVCFVLYFLFCISSAWYSACLIASDQ